MRTGFWMALALAIAGCAGGTQYPLTRAAAAPSDPVLSMPVPLLPAMPVAG